MKQCPRCKSPLTLPPSGKLLCKACALLLAPLEVVVQNEELGKKRFWRRSGYVKRSHDQQPPVCPQSKDYLLSFQNALRKAAALLEAETGDRKVEMRVRQIWFRYLQTAKQRNIKITNIYSQFVKAHQLEPASDLTCSFNCEQEDERPTEQEQPRYFLEEPAHILEESEGFFEQEQEQSKQEFESSQPTKKNKTCFKSQLRKKFKQLQRSHKTKSDDVIEHMLGFLYDCGEPSMTESLLEFISTKYCLFLIERKKKNHAFISKLSTFKPSIKELKTFAEERGYNYTTRNKIQAAIILQDLLNKWQDNLDKNERLEKACLDDLVALYSHHKHSLQNSTVTQFLDYFLNQKEQQANKEDAEFPKLSYSLLNSILFVACSWVSLPLGIDQIQSRIGGVKLQLLGKEIPNEEKLEAIKIRRDSFLLAKIINASCQIGFEGLSLWIHKYVSICKLNFYSRRILWFTHTILMSFLQLKPTKKTEKDFYFLQQDIIAKALLTIFIKCEFGFSRTAYLSAMPPECLQIVGSLGSLQSRKVMEVIDFCHKNKIMNVIESSSIAQIVENLISYGQKQEGSFLPNNPSSYAAIDGLGLDSLLKMVKMNKSTNYFEFKVSLLSTTHCPPTNGSIRWKLIPEPTPALSPELMGQTSILYQQIKTILKTESQQKKIVKAQRHIKGGKPATKMQGQKLYGIEIDVPSCNYQFLYDYYFNIKCIDRQLFVCFAENFVNGSCRMKDFYMWVQQLEKVLIKFQNQTP